MTGIEVVAAERRRQVEAEGYTPSHDDQHVHGELAVAAARYALHDVQVPNDDLAVVRDDVAGLWQWASCYWKPADPIRNLAKAGALIAAEIDRLLRARAAAGQPEPEATGSRRSG